MKPKYILALLLMVVAGLLTASYFYTPDAGISAVAQKPEDQNPTSLSLEELLKEYAKIDTSGFSEDQKHEHKQLFLTKGGKVPDNWQTKPRLVTWQGKNTPELERTWEVETNYLVNRSNIKDIVQDLRAQGYKISDGDVHVFGDAKRGHPETGIFYITDADVNDAARLLNDKRIRRAVQSHPLEGNRLLVPKTKSISAKPSATGAMVASGRTAYSWNLDRVDSRSNSYNGTYDPNNNGKAGTTSNIPFTRPVFIYLLDSGVAPNGSSASAAEFSNRVTHFYDAFSSPGPNYGIDIDGHGTMVADVAMGTTYGIANEAKIKNCKIITATTQDYTTFASSSQFVTVLQNILTDSIAERNYADLPAYSVVSMSFLMNASQATTGMDLALSDLYLQGNLPLVAAAGQVYNSSQSVLASSYWPQNNPYVLRVGMADSKDRRMNLTGYACPGSASFNVYHVLGSHLFASTGAEYNASNAITTCGVKAYDHTGFLDQNIGTSFAAPTVAGAIAQILAVNVDFAPLPGQIYQQLIETATTNIVTNRHISEPDRLLFLKYGMTAIRNAAGGDYIGQSTTGDSQAVCYGIFSPAPATVQTRNTGGNMATGNISYNSLYQQNIWIPATYTEIDKPLDVIFKDSQGLVTAWGTTFILNVNPGIYTTNGYGSGLANGQLLKVDKTTYAQTYVTLSSSGNSWNPSTEDAYLILYGTGIRGHNGQKYFQMKNGGTINDQTVVYAGAGGYQGQDQVNVLLSNSLLGQNKTWDCNLFLNGVPSSFPPKSNTFTVKIN